METEKLVYVKTTEREAPSFRATHFYLKDGIIVFKDGLKEVTYFNLRYVVQFTFVEQ